MKMVLDFDLAKVLEQSKDNPVFYVSMDTPAATPSSRNAGRWSLTCLRTMPVERPLSDDAALRQLADPAGTQPFTSSWRFLPDDRGRLSHMSRTKSLYLYDLASEFHALWTKGRDLPYLRFIINNDAEITKARLAMVQGVVSVLASGLAVLGVHAPTEMR